MLNQEGEFGGACMESLLPLPLLSFHRVSCISSDMFVVDEEQLFSGVVEEGLVGDTIFGADDLGLWAVT